MGCKSKYRDNEASGLQEGCSSASQGRALEPVGDRRSREMTVAPQGEQNPAYSSGSLSNRKFRFGGTSLFFGCYVEKMPVSVEADTGATI